MPNNWNDQTYRVMLYFGNHFYAYKAMREFMKDYGTSCECCRTPYLHFVAHHDLSMYGTNDGVSFLDSRLDFVALDEMCYELAGRVALPYEDMLTLGARRGAPSKHHFNNAPFLPF